MTVGLMYEESLKKGKKDCVSEGLWTYAKFIDRVGLVVAWIVGIAAVIICFSFMNDIGGFTLLLLPVAVLIGFLTYYGSYHLIALAVAGLAEIVNNTSISAEQAAGGVPATNKPVSSKPSESIFSSSSVKNEVVESSDGSWICECGARNNRAVSSCVSCSKSRSGKSAASVPPKIQVSDSWVCTCGTRMLKEAKFCKSCGKRSTEDWICQCGARNKSSSKYCMSCDTNRDDI